MAGGAFKVHRGRYTPPQTGILVPDAATLFTIMSGSPAVYGDQTYLLAANTDFGDLGLGFNFTGHPITIIGQTGTKIKSLELGGAAYQTWKNVNVYGETSPGGPSILVNAGANNCNFVNVTSISSVATATVNGQVGDGWMVRETDKISITGRRDVTKPDMWGRANGITFLDSTNFSYVDMTLENIGENSVQVAGCQTGLVKGSFVHTIFADFTEVPGPHPDNVQLFHGQDNPSNDSITIIDCGWQIDVGYFSQGYFVENCTNLIIQNCWTYGGMPNGISVDNNSSNVLIDNNCALGDSTSQPGILVRGGTVNATMTNNIASGGVTTLPTEGPYPGLVTSGNSSVGAITLGDYSILDTWLAAHPTARARI